MMSDQELARLMKEAMARYNNMSPIQREMHNWAQRISWVYGEIGLECDDDETVKLEDVARQLLTSSVGEAYAYRMLADQEFRQIVGLN